MVDVPTTARFHRHPPLPGSLLHSVGLRASATVAHRNPEPERQGEGGTRDSGVKRELRVSTIFDLQTSDVIYIVFDGVKKTVFRPDKAPSYLSGGSTPVGNPFPPEKGGPLGS